MKDRLEFAEVSVIIPLFNKRKQVARALKSVLGQTHPATEIIVVDDGSTDGSGDVIEEFSDPRIRLVHQPNAGPGAARNRGFNLSHSHWVACLDADDEWLPGFLETALEGLSRHPNCAAAAIGVFRDKGRETESEMISKSVVKGPWQLPTNLPAVEMIHALGFMSNSSTVLRASLVADLGGYYADNKCSYGEDTYLMAQVILTTMVYRDPQPLAWYHTDDSELSFGRRGNYPPVPLVTDAKKVWRRCPEIYRASLSRLIVHYALRDLERAIRAGKFLCALRCLFQSTVYLRAPGPLFALLAKLFVGAFRRFLRLFRQEGTSPK